MIAYHDRVADDFWAFLEERQPEPVLDSLVAVDSVGLGFLVPQPMEMDPRILLDLISFRGNVVNATMDRLDVTTYLLIGN